MLNKLACQSGLSAVTALSPLAAVAENLSAVGAGRRRRDRVVRKPNAPQEQPKQGARQGFSRTHAAIARAPHKTVPATAPKC